VILGAALCVTTVLGMGMFWPALLPRYPLDPPTPPLLKGTTGTGGWSTGGCPPDGSFPTAGQEARSPELEARLKEQFPAGTPAIDLSRALLAQGFSPIENCPNDASISRVTFRQTGGGLFGPYPAFSLVAWKSDASGKVVWTKGTVAYTGP